MFILLHSLILIFIWIREQFLPYLNSSFEIISKLLDEDDEDTIDSVLDAYGQLCITYSKLPNNIGQESKFITVIN